MVNKLFIFAVICSICSQLPFLWETTVGLAMKLTWLAPLFLILMKPTKQKTNKAFNSLLFIFLFFVFYCFLCQLATSVDYFGGDVRNITISFITAFVSMLYWRDYGSQTNLNKIGIYIYITTIILAIYVYLEYYRGADLTGEYAFVAKNSFAYILVGAIIFSYTVIDTSKKSTKYAINTISCILSLIIIVSRSRAVILGLFFLFIYYAIKVRSKIIFISLILLSLLVVCFIVANEELFELIVYGMFLGTDDISDINQLSTGREDVFIEGLTKYKGSPWIGIGRFYFDSMPLAVVFQYGLLGSMIYFYMIYMSYLIIKGSKRSKELYLPTKLLFYTLIINSLFEAYPPFGPGAKCFMLWMMLGFCMGDKIKKKTVYERC